MVERIRFTRLTLAAVSALALLLSPGRSMSGQGNALYNGFPFTLTAAGCRESAAHRPIHQIRQVNLGLPIVDNAYVEDAAREAERLKRWEFMFTLHIFQIQGGTASPFNALATF
jgi:hypothetical protein